MNVVLDTNVVVSGHLNPHGAPALLLDLAVGRRIFLAHDSRVLAEYAEVLARPKFKIPPDRRRAFLDLVRAFGPGFTCVPWKHPLPDPSDEAFLAVASAAHAPLITGNLRHFPAPARAGVKVLSVVDFLKALAS